MISLYFRLPTEVFPVAYTVNCYSCDIVPLHCVHFAVVVHTTDGEGRTRHDT